MIVFGSPARYVQGPGVLRLLGEELARIGKRATLVIDPLIHDSHGPVIAESCARAGVMLRQVRFSGECTPAEIDRLLAEAGDTGIVAAAGGGKCLDAGKALANRIGAAVVTIPTIASTDAPTSHNYVMYDADHRMLGVERLPRNPQLVVVDTEIIAQAPKRLFVAGIGDAIGKVYEAEACANAQGINMFGARSSLGALHLGRACHAVVLADAEAALAAIDRKVPDAALERVVEATVLMSGLAFESGGLSISHSMTRGLTAVPAYTAALHGFQVAYANLVQIRMENRPEAEIRALAEFHARIGLPRSLTELGAPPDDAAFDTIAAGTMTAPHIGHFPRRVGAADIREAMRWIEASFA